MKMIFDEILVTSLILWYTNHIMQISGTSHIDMVYVFLPFGVFFVIFGIAIRGAFVLDEGAQFGHNLGVF